MPAHAPDSITEPRMRNLYRDISRVYEDYCGDDRELWAERTREFVDLLGVIDEKLRFGEQATEMMFRS